MNANARQPLPEAVSFVSYLQRFRKDRGALADLRGALSDARRPNAWPLLAGFKDAIGNPPYETVAALWAGDVDLTAGNGNLGDTLATIMRDNSSFESRFKRLLTCDRDEIAERVAPLVSAAQRKGVCVNYAQLLSDLLCWGDEVRVRWAKAFWAGGDAEPEADPGLLEGTEAKG